MKEETIITLVVLYAGCVAFIAFASVGEWILERALDWRSERFQARVMSRVRYVWPSPTSVSKARSDNDLG